jgi:hypothetical protein
MIAKDSLGFRSEDGGFVTKKEYLGYLHGQVGEEEFTSVGIVVTRAHVYHGKRDDPCLCPLALALKDMFDCEYCEVWRDQITIDGQTYDTTNEMKEFIEYFDKYGCVDTAVSRKARTRCLSLSHSPRCSHAETLGGKGNAP